jgi:GT2 family glycosyltransferase
MFNLKWRNWFSLSELNKVYILNDDDVLQDLKFKKIAIVITVFNQGHLVKAAYNSVVEALRDNYYEFNSNFEIEIILADDCSDNPTLEILEELKNSEAKPFHTRISKTPKNLGVVGNLNYVAKELNCDFLVILNSDVMVFPGFLNAMLLPLILDKSVGAVTLPEFDLFAKWAPIGTNASRLSKFLSNKNGVFCCEASTIISYCVAIKFDTFRNSNFLLDPIYDRGYGEDSDLFYTLRLKGLKSLYSLSNVVSHLGGSSFVDQRNLLLEKAQHTFFGRWGNFQSSFDPRIDKNYHRKIQESLIGYSDNISLQEAKNKKKLIGVITPDIGLEIGGLQVSRELITELNADLVYLTSRDNNHQFLGSYKNASVQHFLDLKMDEVHIVGADSLRILGKSNFFEEDLKTKSFFYFQGFDFFIDPQCIVTLSNYLKRVDVIYYTQLELLKYANYFAPGVRKVEFVPKQTNLTYMKKSSVNYQFRSDVLILLREEHGKAAWLGENMAQFISNEGFSVTTVGQPKGLFISNSIPGIRRLPGLPWKELQNELTNHKVFYDPSLYEGYGLTPREALHNGCKVFINSFGDSLEKLCDSNSNITNFKKPFDLLHNLNEIKKYLIQIK